MFLHLLAGEERAAFLALAHHLIASDGLHIAAEESEMIRRMASEMNIDPQAGDGIAFDTAAGTFTTQRAKDAAYVELLGLAYADDHFSAAESELMRGLADRLSIDARRAGEMDAWVRDIKSVTLRGAELLAV